MTPENGDTTNHFGVSFIPWKLREKTRDGMFLKIHNSSESFERFAESTCSTWFVGFLCDNLILIEILHHRVGDLSGLKGILFADLNIYLVW